jgi:hypothetical protein
VTVITDNCDKLPQIEEHGVALQCLMFAASQYPQEVQVPLSLLCTFPD